MPAYPGSSTLGALWRLWQRRGADLGVDEWERPTRCEGWDVAALYAHVSQGVSGLDALLRRPAEATAPTDDAASLLRRFHEHAGGGTEAKAASELATRNADRAVQDAAETPHAELIARFGSPAEEVVARAAACPDAIVDYFGHAVVRLRDAVLLRIMEATVHLLDLEDALGRTPSVPVDALEQTLRLLVSIPDRHLVIDVLAGRRDHAIFPVIA